LKFCSFINDRIYYLILSNYYFPLFFSSSEGDTAVAHPTTETLQAVSAVEQLLQTKLTPELKELVEESLATIRNPQTCLASVEGVFKDVAKKLYNSLIL
jgi:MFS-type transporter involved in bile tolerance (Atg22 family)